VSKVAVGGVVVGVVVVVGGVGGVGGGGTKWQSDTQ
jgi:hypothetical protein